MNPLIPEIKKIAARASIINLNATGYVDFYITNLKHLPKFESSLQPEEGVYQYSIETGEFEEYKDKILSYTKYVVSFNELTLDELVHLEETAHVRLKDRLIDHTDDSELYSGYAPAVQTPNKHLLKTPFNNSYVIMA